jgi:hypothetical protein
MTDKHHKKDERDPNERLLSLVRWACRERYEVLRLRLFMVRTPSISCGRGRRAQVHRRGYQIGDSLIRSLLILRGQHH